jgi:F-type H+-transporting ATPase subunit b
VRRILLSTCFCAVLFLSGTGTVHAQNTASQEDAAEQEGEFKWHLINSVLFAAVLGFAIWKSAPAFFNARSADIQKAIREATGLKMQADLRYSEIDRKMATLGDEVKRMREQARLEMEREHQRRRDETAAELEHIHNSVAAEIEALRSEGAYQVQQQTAQMAFRLAESKLRDSARSSASDEPFRDFIHLVERGNQ